MGEEKPKPVPEDFDLLAQFNAGREAAFTRIVEKHSGLLISFLYRYTRDRGASEDIAQEAFLRFYKAAADLRPGAKLSTIIYKIAYNLAVDRARREASRAGRAPTQSLDAAPEAAASRADAPDAIFETAQRAREIAGRLAELPDAQQLALLLKVYEDRSYAEIAEIMGVSVASVESLLFRARQTLSRKLK